MSTAFYPTNMRRQSASGYSNKSSLENIPYVSWKGQGMFSNPIGVTSTHIRPLTNKDPGNVFPTGFGLPRPLKQYRKGTVIPVHYLYSTNNAENDLIDYNVNRTVKSSIGSSLGGGNGGTGLISQMIDMPGSFVVKDNSLVDEIGDNLATDLECKKCNGVAIVSDWMPINNLSEKPQPNVTNPVLCCNQQRKAIRRTLPCSTNVKNNYYQTTYMYLYNRCQTFQQRQFNFVTGPIDKKIENLFKSYPFVTAKIIEYSKPGDPLSIINMYVAQCNPNFTIEQGVEIGFVSYLAKSLLDMGQITKEEYDKIISGTLNVESFVSSLRNILTKEEYELVIDYLYFLAANSYNVFSPKRGCSQVYYKPNNPQFAKQGGVSSSTRILKLNVDTISTSAAKNRNRNVLKEKVPACQPQTYIGNPFFFQGQRQNKLICKTKTDGSEYHAYNSVNSTSSGNYIGSTQSRGGGYGTKLQSPSGSYFDNLRMPKS